MRPLRRSTASGKIAAAAAVLAACAALGLFASGAVPPGNDDARASRRPAPREPVDGGRASAPRPDGRAPVADFDKDGYGDYTVSAPKGSVGAKKEAGHITVVYGSSEGAAAGRRQNLHLNSPHVPGRAADEDRFGGRSAARDFDGDGFSDLAVSITNYRDGHRFVNILWGSRNGLTSGTRLDPEARWYQADELAAGDFDGDGIGDLATTGSPSGISVFYGPIGRNGVAARTGGLDRRSDWGSLYVVAGDMTGDGRDDLVSMQIYEEGAEGSRFWKGGDGGLRSTTTKLTSGATGTVGDVDDDGYGDLVMRTVPDNSADLLHDDKGSVKVYYGSPSGPGDETTTVSQDSSSVPGSGAEGDQFGYDLTAGDVDGDGHVDIGVGVPYKSLGTGSDRKEAGIVMLLPGGKRGTFGTGSRVVSQDSGGVPGKAESGDLFGGTVTLRDLDGDGLDELAVGAPGEDGSAKGSGAAWILPVGREGAGLHGGISFDPGDLSAPAEGARLGLWAAE